MKKQKPLLWVVISLIGVALLGGGIFFLTHKKPAAQTATQPEKKKKITAPVNAIPAAERAVVSIQPTADGHNIVITVQELKKPATDLDFEIEYQAGSLLQGAVGALKLASLPAETKILLGSCSAGGACTYNTDVQGGTLTMNFSGGEAYALKNEWKYIENKTKETAFSSKDAKFQVTSPDLAKQRTLIIFNSPGYPGTPQGEVVSEHYVLSGVEQLKGKAKVSIRAQAEGTLKIQGWNGQSWTSFPTTVAKDDAKLATAEVDLMQLYVVTK